MKRLQLIIGFVLTLCIGADAQTKTFSLSDTIFPVGSIYKPGCDLRFSLDGHSYIDETCKPCLDTFAQFLIAHPGIIIEICAHTDQRGADSSNVKISQARANEVKKYLVSKGVPDWKMAAVGYGETQPIHTLAEIHKWKIKQEQELRHQENRRVEFRILRAVYSFSVRDTSFVPGAYLDNNMKYMFNKGTIDSTCFPFLDSLAILLIVHPNIYLRVMTHVDIRSSDNGAHFLGGDRLREIEKYLTKKGVSSDQLLFINGGKSQPIVPLSSINVAPGKEGKEALHAINRRTEFRYVVKPVSPQ